MMLHILVAVGDQMLASDLAVLIRRRGPDISNRTIQSADACPLG